MVFGLRDRQFQNFSCEKQAHVFEIFMLAQVEYTDVMTSLDLIFIDLSSCDVVN